MGELGAFRSRVNPTMLDQLEAVDDADAVELHDLISEHVRRTGSTVGRRVLDEFETLRSKFVKVFPTDYKRVLEQWAQEEQERNAEGQAVSTGGEGFMAGESADG